MRWLWRLAKNGMIALVMISGGVFAWLQLTVPNLDKLPPLHNGDLVFQTIRSHQTTAILLASHTIYSHVGMMKLLPDGTPMVVEAVGPVREIPFKQWLHQGIGQRLMIKRWSDLSAEQAQAILAAARLDYGKPYDFFFLLDDKRIYCSELVYRAYQAGAQTRLGTLQKVAELDIDNFAVQKLLHERWQRHPLCQAAATNNFESCLTIIKQQDIITPVSIADDIRLQTVYDNYGLLH